MAIAVQLRFTGRVRGSRGTAIGRGGPKLMTGLRGATPAFSPDFECVKSMYKNRTG